MSSTNLKMQPTIHLESKLGNIQVCFCIVGCIFDSFRLIIIRELPCITALQSFYFHKMLAVVLFKCLRFNKHIFRIIFRVLPVGLSDHVILSLILGLFIVSIKSPRNVKLFS
jgi:hypothetical protein